MQAPLLGSRHASTSPDKGYSRALLGSALLGVVVLSGAFLINGETSTCCGAGIGGVQTRAYSPAAMTRVSPAAMMSLRSRAIRAAMAAPGKFGQNYARSYDSARSVRRFADVASSIDISSDAYDPSSQKVAFMFPGQGAQYVGMGADLAESVPQAKALYDKASEILGYDLLQVCKEGPKEKLDSTAVSQPAIFVSSMAALEKLKQEKGEDVVNEATVTMGLSLGEYSALCFAGSISFEDGVRLVQERGAAMQAASDMVESSMASVIGLDSAKVKELCESAKEKSGKPVQIANYLCKGNYAVSGAKEAIDTVMEIAKPDFKARMAVKLAVAGAFHTEFMQPAVDRLKAVLETVEVKEPRIPVVSNVDAKAHKDPAVIKEILTQQVTNPVLWENTMSGMLESDFEQAYEIGPGKVLAGILKRFKKDAAMENIEA
mmetsp:Transcript_10980/g.15265  ORF Transcript_10980/g.15265 Transcript_10980/m.15265 type:complete len:432 (+) Transcript_10980:1-1296(+)